MANHGVGADTINVSLRYQFGARQAVDAATISRIGAAESAADATRKLPRRTHASLTDHHDRVLEQALEDDPTVIWGDQCPMPTPGFGIGHATFARFGPVGVILRWVGV